MSSVSTADGQPTLLVRVANQRNNLVIDAEASAMFTYDVHDASGGVAAELSFAEWEE